MLIISDINKSLTQLQTVIDYFDTATQEEPNITKGYISLKPFSGKTSGKSLNMIIRPEEIDLTSYLKSVQRMKDALAYLKESNYKSADRGVMHLVRAINLGLKA